MTEKLVCVVPAPNPKAARGKLKKLMQEHHDHDPQFDGTSTVSLIKLVEITKAPDNGIAIHHEVSIEHPTIMDAATDLDGVRGIRIRENERTVWTLKA